MCTMPATTDASGSGEASTSTSTSTDLIGERSRSHSHSCHQGHRLNLRIFKLLISCCLLMLSIYPNAWHLSISPRSGSGSGSFWAMADSIKGRGDAHRLDTMGSQSHTSSSSSVPSSWLTQSNNHANISELLDNLLRGYDNSIRPDFGGPPATVEVDIMVRSMGPISEVDMTYSMDCYFRQSWVDKRLAFEGAQDTLALSVSMLARIWKPDTYFYNGKQSYLHTITTPNKFVRIYQNGRVLYSSRLTIKAGCPMNLADFPMDIQKCPLKFGSFGYTTSDVIYRWNKERPPVAIAEDMKLSQFDLVDCPAGNLTDIVYKAAAPRPQRRPFNNKDPPRPTSKVLTTFAGPAAKNQHVRGTGLKLDKGAFGTGRDTAGGAGSTTGLSGTITLETNHPSEYSMLMVNFHLQRHMGNFLIQVYGPCCLLVVLSWVSFWLNREATADRVSLGITTVLTMTFLGLEARTDLPKVSYPTALDFFVFLSFGFIFATILQFAVVHYYTKYGSGECYFIIEELDSDSGESETEALTSDFRDSTESKIYEVIPLSMCAISMPPPPSSRLGMLTSRNRGPRNRRHGLWSMKLLGLFDWRRRRKPTRVDSDEEEDDEQTQLRVNEAPSTSAAAAAAAAQAVRSSPPTGGRRRMSYYRREEMEARRKGKRTPQYNSVSKIDRASRIVFPLLFILINVFYWYGYLSRSSRILANTPDAST
ncbi:gamma-aminobutyric acid receptor alpha-like [Drosophila gunungcola]|uniref:gamma-aminobutyric acid receptor alpha-like n=1 Tax=Drosophila gunungcola TaxID=103775 RepID=UPI0022E2440B|nr:gamma-aminobutyric acid receptor alpha-like [Drosophila gunungcola]XP_052844213.1 gamma-aminobutyric acid receptor alpha-like [Drosophila gunungcola]XP_052844214.1 gamma-aminobutyric acid receptor alpha-like [Drosophila gunungcola]